MEIELIAIVHFPQRGGNAQSPNSGWGVPKDTVAKPTPCSPMKCSSLWQPWSDALCHTACSQTLLLLYPRLTPFHCCQSICLDTEAIWRLQLWFLLEIIIFPPSSLPFTYVGFPWRISLFNNKWITSIRAESLHPINVSRCTWFLFLSSKPRH